MKPGIRTIQAQLLVKAPPSWCSPGSAQIWWLLPRSSLFQIWTTSLGSRRSSSVLLQQPIPFSLILIWTPTLGTQPSSSSAPPMVWSLLSIWTLPIGTHPPSHWPRSDLLLLRVGPSIWAPPIWSSTPPSAPLQIWPSPSSVWPRSVTEEILSDGDYCPPSKDLLQIWIKGIDFFPFYLLTTTFEDVTLVTVTIYLLCYPCLVCIFLAKLLKNYALDLVFWYELGHMSRKLGEMSECLPGYVSVPLRNYLSNISYPYAFYLCAFDRISTHWCSFTVKDNRLKFLSKVGYHLVFGMTICLSIMLCPSCFFHMLYSLRPKI